MACGGSDVSVSLVTGGAELPPFPKECISADGLPDEIVLANEVLARRSDDLVFDKGERHRLASAIRLALAEIRERHPVLNMVHPVPEVDPQGLGVGLTARSMDIVVEATNGEEFSGPIETGLAGLDALNSQLGLRGIWWSRSRSDGGGSVWLCLNDRVSTRVAVTRYAELNEMEYAETGGVMSTGPYSDIAVTEGNGALYMVARLVPTNCFLNCADFYYFRVDSGSGPLGGPIEQIDDNEAQADETFQELLEFLG